MDEDDFNKRFEDIRLKLAKHIRDLQKESKAESEARDRLVVIHLVCQMVVGAACWSLWGFHAAALVIAGIWCWFTGRRLS